MRWNTVLEQICVGTEAGRSELSGCIQGDSGRMPSANDYRRYSAECLTLAERVTDSADKARLIQMAQAFLELANKQEQKDSSPGD
jgi:hypothetical protein